jgi:hypothetical protein
VYRLVYGNVYELAEIDEQLRWIDVSNKQLNKLTENLINCNQTVAGKTLLKKSLLLVVV